MYKIKVSVIVPVFNASKYISKSLSSIINQNFDNYEIIIINDGSQDDSIEKSHEILSKSKIPYEIINQNNNGVSNARNHGLEIAKGEYIIFVDDDDYISQDHISSLYNSTKNNNTDFAFTKLLKINSNEEILTNIDEYRQINDKTILKTLDLIKLDLKMKIPFSFSQILYKSSIIEENNLKFNENYLYGEDTDFALKALFFGNNISIVKKPTYFYLQHQESSSSKLYLPRFDIVAIFDNLAIYFKENNHHYSDDEIKELNKLIKHNRIPKAIFGNLMYFFYNDYDLNNILDEMKKLNLFSKLSNFKIVSFKDILFLIKTKIFLLNPTIYYKIWKKLKNSI